MTVAKHKVVTIEYTLKNDEGDVIDSSVGGDPLTYLHGASNIISGLEKALEGMSPGDSTSVRVPPSEGYGDHNAELIQNVPKAMFGGTEIKVDEQYHAEDPNGNPVMITVREVGEEEVTIDGNHPLAGIHLNFDVTIIETRDASEEELEHGHAHGPGGHHH
ncbi:MAG: peptidylprolyl isomerase [Gammaproteobacteria bacterium]|nr:peptidylprolyl isomerase [Gammaproteobacteria bacterium]MDH5692057.1 peptidylprolyl isomerase [Gammaproteobacteria bacterium]